jgi:glutamate N-acetyltransferase/amino-acid N-acetyltransferase
MTVFFLEHGHVASPAGWRAATAVCEIKYGPGRPDLALLCSDRPCAAAAIFTTNRVKAAPLLYDQALMARNAAGLRAVVINSGNANACTGEPGAAAVVAMAQTVAQNLDIAEDTVFVMSTGTIGVPMPVEKVTRGIAAAAQQLDPTHGPRAAEAIMTTDTRPKYCAVSVTLPGGGMVRIGGMAKGAGMIHPNMATMLGIITTDAAVTPGALDAALRYAADRSFHCISVDGDTSTNDTLLVLANGMAGAPISDIQSADGQAFLEGLIAVCQWLAQAVVRDGEGITRFVTITVRGATSDADAHRAAMAVARSPLVKTALFGADPNWGRVLCAMGYSGAELNPDQVVLHFGGLRVLERGQPLDFDEQAAHALLDQAEIVIEADLGLGVGSATVWTCDFSYEYVRINAEYRT